MPAQLRAPHADDCKLDAWVAGGHADVRRLESFRRLLTSRDQTST